MIDSSLSFPRNAKTDMRDGVGVMFWPDGSKYEGHWRRDKANGKGRIIHANGDVYYGKCNHIMICGGQETG
jgi:hypothetical protein